MRTVLIYSGGLDSTVLLYKLLADGHEVKALTIDYGQRAEREIDYARAICSEEDVDHRIVDLRCLGPLLSSTLTSNELQMPLGHYNQESMKATVVPNRNMIMLSIAGGWAISLKYENVAYAAQVGDYGTYPDCREPFIKAMGDVLQLADWHPIQLWCPFARMSKCDIIRLGKQLEVSFEKTWSCYSQNEVQCGVCSSCIARREGFHIAGIQDPTIYRDEAPSTDIMVQNNWQL